MHFIVVVVMCGIFLLTGCGDAQQMPETVDKTESVEIMEMPEDTVLSRLEPSPSIHADNPQEQNMAGLLQETAAEMMVQIQIGNVIGSGVIWDITDDKLVIATAGHVLTTGNGEIQVVFADGWTGPSVEYKLTNTDLAFLFIDMQAIPEEHLTQYYLVNINEESAGRLQNGDGIILMGSGTGVAADAYEGVVIESWIYIEDFAEYMILVDAEAESGMSGGGLFDYEGNFHGILCGTNEDGETVVLPLSIINAFYEII